MKLYKLRRWRWSDSSATYHFFTCARPGRTGDPKSKNVPVSEQTVKEWLSTLPGPRTAIVSLLGRKPDGMSEFEFYDFYGGFDKPNKHTNRKSFRKWLLDQWKDTSFIELREHPTIDFEKVPEETRIAASNSIIELLREGYTVTLIDSGGEVRTKQVCNHMKATEDSSTN